MRLRKLAGTTAGALVLGALSVPMTISSAHAAPATAGTASFTTTCSSTAAGRTSTTTLAGALTVTVDGTSVSATMNATANFAAAALQIKNLAPKFVLDIDGAAVTVAGDKAISPPVAGDTDIALPAMTGSRTATAAPVKFDVTSAEVSMTMQFASATYTCVLPDIAPVTFPAPAKDLNFTCSAFGASFQYPSNLALTAQAKADGKIAVSASMDKMPNPAPAGITLKDQTFAGALRTDKGELTGSNKADFAGGTPIAIPSLAGSVTASGSTMTVAVQSFELAVPSFQNMKIPCTLAAPKTFTVDIKPVSKVCTDAIAGLPGAQTSHSGAIASANAAAASVKAASTKSTSATKALSKAKSKAKKAAKAVKKAKAKKAKAKAKKANAKAKKAVKKATQQLKTAKSKLAAAKSTSAAANGQVAATAATVAALQNAAKNC